MFILYAVIIGIIAGYLRGGRLKNIIQRPLKHVWLAVSGFLVQIVIFSDIPAFQLENPALAVFYGISYLLIFAFVIVNRKVPGIILIGVGMILNATAIFANGGHMPTSLENFEKTGIEQSEVEALRQGSTTNNSQVITDDTILPWLGDIFYIPSWMPFSNVFSIGDLFITAGVCMYFIFCMKPVHQPVHQGNE